MKLLQVTHLLCKKFFKVILVVETIFSDKIYMKQLIYYTIQKKELLSMRKGQKPQRCDCLANLWIFLKALGEGLLGANEKKIKFIQGGFFVYLCLFFKKFTIYFFGFLVSARQCPLN